MAIVRLKLGDMFDGPSDLIVFPCSTRLGDVNVMPFQGECLAKFLRESGIDARLDVWNLRHGMDVP